MGRQKTEKAYLQLIEMVDELQQKSFKRAVVSEEYAFNRFTRTTTGNKTLAVQVDFTMVNLELPKQLSSRAFCFVAEHIITELRMNNLLWYHPVIGNNSHLRAILAELKMKRVIFPTEVTGIYLVNPIKVWRGTIHGAVQCTKDALRENGKVPSLELIRDLRLRGDSSEVRTGQELLDQLSETKDNSEDDEMRLLD